MIAIGVRYDPGELDAMAARLQSSIRRLGGGTFARDVEALLVEENARHALAGLNRHGRSMNPWRVRRGRSDYHDWDYRAYSHGATLVPFGPQSRRIDAFRVSVSRRSALGVGFGAVTFDAGFDALAGRLPDFWRRRDATRDVLGMPPRTRRAVGLLCTRHASYAHSLLKRGAARVRSAAAFMG